MDGLRQRRTNEDGDSSLHQHSTELKDDKIERDVNEANEAGKEVKEKPINETVKDATTTTSPSALPVPPATKKPQSLLQKTIVRSVVGVLMMIFFYAVLQIQHKYITIFIVLAQLVTWNEVVSLRYKIDKERHLTLFRTINWYFLFVSFLFFYGKGILLYLKSESGNSLISGIASLTYDYSRAIIFLLYVAGFVAFILSLRENSLRYQFSQLTWTILTLLLVVGQTHFSMQYLYDGIVWILLPHGLIIFNDIMAYFCGISMGRKIIDRPLFPLSPNKTWEGFIGAMIFTVIFAFFISPIFIKADWFICPAGLWNATTQGCDIKSFNHGSVFQLTKYKVPFLSDWGLFLPEVSLYPLQIHAVFFALFASIIAPFGGFLASGIKRAFNKKDFDTIFPGHGGFMDRVDCQLLMCSFVYIYVTTFIKTEPPTVEVLIAKVQTLSPEDQLMLYKFLQQLVGGGGGGGDVQ